MNLEIFLHVLVLEEEVLISEEALGKLGSRHNLSNCHFASLWARLSKDGVEGLASWDGLKLVKSCLLECACEAALDRCVWLKDKFEGELGVGNLLAILADGGDV